MLFSNITIVCIVLQVLCAVNGHTGYHDRNWTAFVKHLIGFHKNMLEYIFQGHGRKFPGWYYPPSRHYKSYKTGYKDCADLRKHGEKWDGVYTIFPSDKKGPLSVYCDMTTDGGGWTVFQRRQDGSVDFYRGWKSYKNGFGKTNKEFWLGNDNIYRLSHQKKSELRVDLQDFSGKKVYAKYDLFAISSENKNYKLKLGKYSGTAGDSMSGHNGHMFSTKDRDNDVYGKGSCATTYKGAWWYSKCHASNLNGLYHKGKHKSYADGVNWSAYKGYYYSLKKTEMKMRPVGFKA